MMKSNLKKSISVKQFIKKISQIPLLLLSILIAGIAMMSFLITMTLVSFSLLVLYFKNISIYKVKKRSNRIIEGEYHIVE